MVWKLDRLGHRARDLVMLVTELQERSIHFRSFTGSIDTSTATGRFFLHVMSVLAEMGRELIVERTRTGLAAAREQGVSAAADGSCPQKSLSKAAECWRTVPPVSR